MVTKSHRVYQAQRTAAVIPKMEKIMSDRAHTCMPAKKTVVKATMDKRKKINMVLGSLGSLSHRVVGHNDSTTVFMCL